MHIARVIVMVRSIYQSVHCASAHDNHSTGDVGYELGIPGQINGKIATHAHHYRLLRII